MNILKKKNVIRSIADDVEIFSDDFDKVFMSFLREQFIC